MIKNFRHACVLVKDLDRSLKFYRDILGFKVTKSLTIEGKYPETILGIKKIKLTYVKMRVPGQPRGSQPIFELHYWHRPKKSPQKGYGHISLTMKNIDAAYKRLRKLGVKFISRPTGAADSKAKVCFGYDPDGNLIEFVQG